jgi:hypothetical protein
MEKEAIKVIEEAAVFKYGSFRRFAIKTGQNESNFKRKLSQYLKRLNGWLIPLGLKVTITRR